MDLDSLLDDMPAAATEPVGGDLLELFEPDTDDTPVEEPAGGANVALHDGDDADGDGDLVVLARRTYDEAVRRKTEEHLIALAEKLADDHALARAEKLLDGLRGEIGR